MDHNLSVWDESLNAPFGARCFLTAVLTHCPAPSTRGLNAPFGARRFLTGIERGDVVSPNFVS